MNAVTGVAIITQAITVISVYPLIILANIPLLLADSPRLLFHPPPSAPWYNSPPVRRLFHNWRENTLSLDEAIGTGNKCRLSSPRISWTAPLLSRGKQRDWNFQLVNNRFHRGDQQSFGGNLWQ
jgi:hypothetical protein